MCVFMKKSEPCFPPAAICFLLNRSKVAMDNKQPESTDSGEMSDGRKETNEFSMSINY